MRQRPYSAFELAQRYVGTKEVNGQFDNPQIMAWLKLDGNWPEHDEVPWCSAFVNGIAHAMRLPRSKSLRARSWLAVGESILIEDAETGFDVVILERGGGDQPGPDVIDAPGHVGFFAGKPYLSGSEISRVYVLGGNQSNSVSVQSFPVSRVLGVRRLA